MPKRFIIALCLYALLTSVSFSQSSVGTLQAARLSFKSDSPDPLGILEHEDNDEKKPAVVRNSVVAGLAAIERSAFDLVNHQRQVGGLKPLIWSNELADVARFHSHNMAEFAFFSHRGLDSKLVSDRADAYKIGRWRAIGENIAFNRGYDDPTQKAVALWLDSSTHRHNMMDPEWRESAVGVAVGSDGSYYFTQVFLVRRK